MPSDVGPGDRKGERGTKPRRREWVCRWALHGQPGARAEARPRPSPAPDPTRGGGEEKPAQLGRGGQRPRARGRTTARALDGSSERGAGRTPSWRLFRAGEPTGLVAFPARAAEHHSILLLRLPARPSLLLARCPTSLPPSPRPRRRRQVPLTVDADPSRAPAELEGEGTGRTDAAAGGGAVVIVVPRGEGHVELLEGERGRAPDGRRRDGRVDEPGGGTEGGHAAVGGVARRRGDDGDGAEDAANRRPANARGRGRGRNRRTLFHLSATPRLSPLPLATTERRLPPLLERHALLPDEPVLGQAVGRERRVLSCGEREGRSRAIAREHANGQSTLGTRRRECRQAGKQEGPHSDPPRAGRRRPSAWCGPRRCARPRPSCRAPGRSRDTWRTW